MERAELLPWLSIGVPLAVAVLIGLVLLVPAVRPGRLRSQLDRWERRPARRQGLEIVGSTLLVAGLLLAVQWVAGRGADAAVVAGAMALTLLGWGALLLVPHGATRGPRQDAEQP